MGLDPISDLAVLIDTQCFGRIEALNRWEVSATVLNTEDIFISYQ